MTDAARQARRRDRIRRGKRLVEVEIDDVAVPQMLVEARLLAPHQTDDSAAIAAALERLIAALASHA